MTQLLSSAQENKLIDFGTKVSAWVQSYSFLRWFVSKGYAQGVFWAIMITLVSVTNDILMRFLGERLNSIEIVFFRFFFSLLSVLPIMVYRGQSAFITARPQLHVWRAIVGVGALTACCFSVNLMPLADNTTIMFSQPLFFLPLAVLFLRETVDKPRWIATIVGFIGILIIIRPGTEAFQLVAIIPITAAILFATLDVMAKKMVVNENMVTMIFYFGLGTTIAGFIPALFVWKTPTMGELGLLICLGIGANLIQVCIYRAFSATDASALQPFRYVELLFVSLFAFVLFAEIPTIWILLGAPLVIASTLYLSYYENRKEKKATLSSAA